MDRDQRAQVEWTVRSLAQEMGFEPLRLTLSRNRHLILTVDRDGPTLTIADLTSLNHAIRAALRRAGHDPDSFAIEVESPGPRRPLLHRHHYERLQGQRVRIRVSSPLPDGQVVVVGILAGLDGDRILVKTGRGAPLGIPLPAISEANLHP
jgi:ribosome maturation factor RimP